jgi:hypothetical protein
MENSPHAKYPQILVHAVEPERKLSGERNALSPEPEVEECCEDVQLREVVQGLGIDYELVSQLKYISHEPETENCLHCKLLSKVSSLQEGINRISNEIGTTQDVLKQKKSQNTDLKMIIERLEGSIGQSIASAETVLDKSGKSCSCSSSCAVL